MATILTVSASPSAVSKTARTRRFLDDHFTGRGHTVHAIDVRDLPADALLAADTRHPGIARVLDLFAGADGVVVATPVYKASYSGLLKVLLDLLPQKALHGKVVLPVATGGTLAHLLVLDYALRPVLTALGSTEVVQGYFLLDQLLSMDGDRVAFEGDAEQSLLVAAGRLTAALAAKDAREARSQELVA